MNDTSPLQGSAAPGPAIHLFQIVYSEETAQLLQPGFDILDNRANPRPDWFEYWPIRNFLRTTALDEEAFYAFFSPRFAEKLGVGAAFLRDFIARHASAADVVIFSPQPDEGAMFLNVFEQAECYDRGMISTYEAVLSRARRRIDLAALVMDSRRISFCNYFAARPAFWRAWLELNEELFRIAEDADDPLGEILRESTAYRGAAQRKVFLQERTASFLLAENRAWRSVRCNPFRFAWGGSIFRTRPLLVVLSDALKMAFSETGDMEYIHAYSALRADLLHAGSADASYARAIGLGPHLVTEAEPAEAAAAAAVVGL